MQSSLEILKSFILLLVTLLVESKETHLRFLLLVKQQSHLLNEHKEYNDLD